MALNDVDHAFVSAVLSHDDSINNSDIDCDFFKDIPSKAHVQENTEKSLNSLHEISNVKDISCLVAVAETDANNVGDELQNEDDIRDISFEINHSVKMDHSTINKKVGRPVETSHFSSAKNAVVDSEMLESKNVRAAIDEQTEKKKSEVLTTKNGFVSEHSYVFETKDNEMEHDGEMEQTGISLNEGETDDGVVDTEQHLELNASLPVKPDLNSSEKIANSSVGQGSVVIKLKRKKSKKRKKKSTLWCRQSPYKVQRTSLEKNQLSDPAVVITNELSADAGPETVSKKVETSNVKIDELYKDSSQSNDKEEIGIEKQIRKRGRNTSALASYILADAMEELIHSDGNKKSKGAKGIKKQSLLFHKGKRASLSNVKPLSEEEAEQYKEPFKLGWGREVVIRSTSEGGKTQCDVYYFPPSGTKIRSMIQIGNWLSMNPTSLTADNFTFMRRPIGMESGEVVRHAAVSRGRIAMEKRIKKANDDSKVHDDADGHFDNPEVVIERDSDDILAPVTAAEISTDVSGTGETLASPLSARNEVPSPKMTPSKRGRKPKIKPIVFEKIDNADKVKEDKKVNEEKEEVTHPSNEMVIVFPSINTEKVVKQKATARKSTSQKVFKKSISYTGVENLCSLACPGMEGMPPMLHCSVCMCLFHNECVNFFGQDDFVCLRCKDVTLSSPEHQINHKRTEALMMTVSTPILLNDITNNALQTSSIRTLTTPSSTCGLSQNSSFPCRPITTLPTLVRVMTPPTSLPQFNTMHYEHMKSISNSQSVAYPLMTSTPNFTSPHIMHHNPKSSTKSTQYAEIRPLIKEEPIDDSYVTTNNDKGGQASAEALGNLKSVLNSRSFSTSTPIRERSAPLSSSMSANMTQNKHVPHLTSLLNFGSNIFPSYSARTANTNMKFQSAPNPLGALANMQYSQNSGYRIVPLGPPVALPNMQFQQVQIPGLPVQGLIPITNAQPISSAATKSSQIQKQNSTRAANSDYSLIESSSHDTQNVSGPLVVNSKSMGGPMNGQLLTLPPAFVKLLTLNKPLGLKINDRLITVPPSGLFQSSKGLKVFVPPNTFPSADETDVSVVNKTREDVSANKQKSPSKTDQLECKKCEHSHDDAYMESHTCALLDIKSEKMKRTTEANENVSENSGSKQLDIQTNKLYKFSCLIQKLYGGCDCMLHVFSYLGIKELIRVSAVCHSWRMISMLPPLWTNVSFSGVVVSDWQKAMQFVSRRHVQSLNLVGLSHFEDPNRTWHQLVSSLQNMSSLSKISFGLVPSTVLLAVCGRLTELNSLCAEHITDFTDKNLAGSVPSKLDIGKFSILSNLEELQLKGTGGLSLPFGGSLSDLGSLTNLKVLCLTSLKNVPASDFNFMSKLVNLKVLALGDCKSWTHETYTHLQSVTHLEKLRLENGGMIPDNGLGQALEHFHNLNTLELYTYTIANTFGAQLCKLNKLRKLVIWPDNTDSPADVNTNMLSALEALSGKSLECLDWIISNSSSTSIILDDNESTEKSIPEQNQQWIPFCSTRGQDGDASLVSAMSESTVREYISCQQLTDKLKRMFPNTRIKVYCMKKDAA